MDDAEEVDLESDLLDLTGISLEQLDALPDSVLGASLRRILAERETMPDQYAFFQNAL
ncbi:MAG: FxSxx-COOH cyclophane-containing RiPP peptide [Pseudonocardiaceae bacterium]